MKKKALFLTLCGFIAAAFMIAPVVSADEMVPGAYVQQDQSVMGVGQTMVQMGAQARTITDAVNRASRANRSWNSDFGMNQDYQFGSSQYEQSWKAARTVEEAQVHGLVAGDCQGENSDDVYRNQMKQSRAGFVKEILVSNAQCGEYHPTLK